MAEHSLMERLASGGEATTGPSFRSRLWALALSELSTAAVMLVAVLAVTVPYFSVPQYWDAFHVVTGAEHVLENGFRPFLPMWWDNSGHPVLFFEILALAWLVLGQTLWVSHLLIALFAFTVIYFTYRIGHLLYGRKVGLIAAVLLLFFPLFRTQAAVVVLDLPTAAFTVCAIYFLLTSRTPLYLLFASAAVLTKETGALLVPAVLVYVFLRDYRRKTTRTLLIDVMVHSIPAWVLVSWFWYHAAATGWVAPPGRLSLREILLSYLPPTLFAREGVFISFLQLSWQFLGKQFLIGLLSLTIIVSGFSWRAFSASLQHGLTWRGLRAALRAQPFWQGRTQVGVVVLLGLPIVTHLLFMASNWRLHRYLLPEYPLYFVLAAEAIFVIFRRRLHALTFTAFVLVVFAAGWARPWFGNSLSSPSTSAYLDFVANEQAGVAFLESNFPDKVVLTDWPGYFELARPSMGYARQHHRIVSFASDPSYAARMVVLGGRYYTDASTVTLDDFDIVYYTARTNTGHAYELEIAHKYQLPLVAEFTRGDEYAAIYAKPETLGAPPQPYGR